VIGKRLDLRLADLVLFQLADAKQLDDAIAVLMADDGADLTLFQAEEVNIELFRHGAEPDVAPVSALLRMRVDGFVGGDDGKINAAFNIGHRDPGVFLRSARTIPSPPILFIGHLLSWM